MSRPKASKKLKKAARVPKKRGKFLSTDAVDLTNSTPLPTETQHVSSNWKHFLQQNNSMTPARSATTSVSVGRPSSIRSPSSLAAKSQCSNSSNSVCHCRPRPQVWFDGVDPELLKDDKDLASSDDDQQLCQFCQRQQQNGLTGSRVKQPQLSRHLAMDCEMVGVGRGGVDNALARVSIVNALCQPVYDKYVRPREKVTDYRTAVSGVRPEHLRKAAQFEMVQHEVCQLLRGRVLVGHALHNDLRVLLLSHPRRYVRDTANYKPFRRLFNGRVPSLKNLAHTVLAVKIQSGEHDSVQDARAAMQLYQMHRREWESSLASSGSIK